jgi:hypothetical protein
VVSSVILRSIHKTARRMPAGKRRREMLKKKF